MEQFFFGVIAASAVLGWLEFNLERRNDMNAKQKISDELAGLGTAVDTAVPVLQQAVTGGGLTEAEAESVAAGIALQKQRLIDAQSVPATPGS